MWLLDTTKLTLHHAMDSRGRPGRRYAILSHTWGDGEVTFQDLASPETAKYKPGWAKIEAACRIARRKYRWAWVDTCCIDKTSSAELSEAINSMFAWYRDSSICYVYLEDLEPIYPYRMSADRRSSLAKRLTRCRWFTRGWTLQELIAPRQIDFFDKEWNFVGAKADLEDVLSSITNVDVSILRDSSMLHSVPVARRMSWAADRQTTRVEDRAYCLLGIFDVNMPLLYGEGSSAFIRLQEHLANHHNDLSLFAWQVEVNEGDTTLPVFGGIFAEQPQFFRHCSTLKRHRDSFQLRNEFTITNNGLKMEAMVRRLRTGWLAGSSATSDPDYLLSLDCIETSDRTGGDPKWLGICLTKVGSTFVRLRPHMVYVSRSRSDWTKQSVRLTMYICRSLSPVESERIEAFIGSKIRIELNQTPLGAISNPATFPSAVDSPATSKVEEVVFDCHGRDNFIGLLRFTVGTCWRYAVLCGIQWTGEACEPWVAVYGNNDESGTAASGILAAAFPPGDGSAAPDLEEIKDILLCEYSDMSGLYRPDRMPTKRVQYREDGTSGSRLTCHVRKTPIGNRPLVEMLGDENALTARQGKNVFIFRLKYDEGDGLDLEPQNMDEVRVDSTMDDP